MKKTLWITKEYLRIINVYKVGMTFRQLAKGHGADTEPTQ